MKDEYKFKKTLRAGQNILKAKVCTFIGTLIFFDFSVLRNLKQDSRLIPGYFPLSTLRKER